MFARLPPVFQAATCQQTPGTAAALAVPAEYHLEYYRSGAAALAAVLHAARLHHGGEAAEVLIPAYTCPEVVSAALHAGLRPVLVDLEAERPWLSLAELEAALSPRVAAIVAINFLGIPERLAALRTLADRAGALLIEDCAQWYPEAGLPPLTGAARIHSFGRGKPVNLLGGGLAIIADAGLQRRLPPGGGVAVDGLYARWRQCARALAFNTVTLPWCYGLLSRLPGLSIGETSFHALTAIDGMPRAQWVVLGAAIRRYREQAAQRSGHVALIDRHLEDLRGPALINLPRVCGSGPSSPLLRYPLLCATAAQRDALHARLEAQGLGGSRLYPAILPELPGMPRERIAAATALARARDFAARLLTLPVHVRVGDRLDDIAACLREILPTGEAGG